MGDAVSDDALRDGWERLVSRLVAAMVVVTVRVGDERDGCLVGFTSQVSIVPPRFLVCPSVRNRTTRVAVRATHLGVHVVPDARRDLAELFGGETGDDVDKLARAAWREGPHGVPLLDGCPAWFVGEVHERVELGDHLGHVLVPVAVSGAAEGAPLLSVDALSIDPGHDP